MVEAKRDNDAVQDAALVDRLRFGDTAALEALYDRYGRTVYALARRILCSEQLAEEVAQEVFLAVWRDAPRFDRRRGTFASWILTMTHHKAVDAVRKEENQRKRRAPLELLEQTESGAPSVLGTVSSTMRGERVQAAMRDLPDPQRQALTLAYFGGYTQREIAGITKTPIGTVKTRMLAGMRKLRDRLSDDGPGVHP